MANKNNSSRVWLSQFHDKVTPIPSIEETVDPKIEALQAIMDRAIPVRAETLVMSLPAPTKFEGFHKSQEANIDALEKSSKELDKLNVDVAEISKSLELQFKDAGNNKQVLTQAINGNDYGYSGLLNIPAKVDDWFNIIDDMAKEFYNQHGKRPNETQAWGRLWTIPPAGYAVTTGRESVNSEDYLYFPSATPLSKSSFIKRWKKYTNNTQ